MQPTEQFRVRKEIAAEGIFRSLALLLLSILIQTPVFCPAEETPAPGLIRDGSKRVLVLASYGSTLPAYRLLSTALQAELEAAGIRTEDIFFEYRSPPPAGRRAASNLGRTAGGENISARHRSDYQP